MCTWNINMFCGLSTFSFFPYFICRFFTSFICLNWWSIFLDCRMLSFLVSFNWMSTISVTYLIYSHLYLVLKHSYFCAQRCLCILHDFGSSSSIRRHIVSHDKLHSSQVSYQICMYLFYFVSKLCCCYWFCLHSVVFLGLLATMRTLLFYYLSK